MMSPAAAKRVLIVEDNPLNMKLFVAMVLSQKLDTLQATDGHAGVELAREQRPDLILMDIDLPKLSGLDAAAMLKQDPSTRDIPIVLTTAARMSPRDKQIRETGCEAFLAKPIAVAEFLDTLDHFLLPLAAEALSPEELLPA